MPTATKARVVKVGPYHIGPAQPLLIIAGPCVIESKAHALRHAKKLKALSESTNIPCIFKASYDKANRTSVQAYRGPGIEEGLAILQAIKSTLNMPVITDVHTPESALKAGKVLDMIQIPAFLCRQTDLLLAAGESGCAINIKKGQFLAPEDMRHAALKVKSTGNKRIVLTDRGATFGYGNLVSDFRSIPIMQDLGYPVIFDATHSVQRPGGLGHATGGDRRFAPYLASAAAAIGVNGIFMEVHENPDKALSDGPNSLPLKSLKKLWLQLKALSEIAYHDN